MLPSSRIDRSLRFPFDTGGRVSVASPLGVEFSTGSDEAASSTAGVGVGGVFEPEAEGWGELRFTFFRWADQRPWTDLLRAL